MCLHWQVVLFNCGFLHNCTASCYWVHRRAGKGRLKIVDEAHSNEDPPTASSLFTRWGGFPQIWRLNKDGVLQPRLAGAAAQSIGNWMVIQCRRFGNFRWCRTKGWPRGWSPRTWSRLITYRGAVCWSLHCKLLGDDHLLVLDCLTALIHLLWSDLCAILTRCALDFEEDRCQSSNRSCPSEIEHHSNNGDIFKYQKVNISSNFYLSNKGFEFSVKHIS